MGLGLYGMEVPFFAWYSSIEQKRGMCKTGQRYKKVDSKQSSRLVCLLMSRRIVKNEKRPALYIRLPEGIIHAFKVLCVQQRTTINKQVREMIEQKLKQHGVRYGAE